MFSYFCLKFRLSGETHFIVREYFSFIYYKSFVVMSVLCIIFFSDYALSADKNKKFETDVMSFWPSEEKWSILFFSEMRIHRESDPN